jgi:hypothetical protein
VCVSSHRKKEREIREFERQQREKGEEKAAKREERADLLSVGEKKEKKRVQVM